MPHRVPRRFRRCLSIVAALLGTVTSTLAQESRPGSILAQFEDALTGVIESCEPAVVSITRTDQPLSALSLQSKAGQRMILRGGANNRIFFPQQGAFPGALGGLQPAPNIRAVASGAGVVIDSEQGLILTQYRVAKLGDTHLVTDVEGQRYAAQIRAADPRSGLAVLAIRSRFPADGVRSSDNPIRLPALPIGRAEDLKKGRLVVAIGNPYSIESDGQPTASWGSITNTAAKFPSGENLNDLTSNLDGSYRTTLHHFGSLIQTDAKLGWNASGGALVDLSGKLVGIVTTASTIAGHEQPAGYAIPLNKAMRRAVDSMRRGVEPEYGLLGVGFGRGGAARSTKTGEVGIAINNAFKGGPAQRAGLRSNDLLLSVDGVPIRSADALQLTVGSLPPGQRVDVKFERAGKRSESQVVLGKAYIEQGQIISRRQTAWRGIRVDYATAIPPEVLSTRADAGYLDEGGCVAVVDVEEGSVSWESGVRPYNFISHVSGERVTSPAEFYQAVRDASDNVKLKFTKPLGARAELN